MLLRYDVGREKVIKGAHDHGWLRRRHRRTTGLGGGVVPRAQLAIMGECYISGAVEKPTVHASTAGREPRSVSRRSYFSRALRAAAWWPRPASAISCFLDGVAKLTGGTCSAHRLHAAASTSPYG